MLDLQEFLFARGLPRDAKTKLVRHQDARWDVPKLISLGQFEVYQQYQSKPVFDCAFIVSFVGQSYSHSRLIGVYAVKGREKGDDFKLPDDYLYPDMPVGPYRYDLERAAGYEDLERRVIINWGDSTRSWHQWLKPKEIVEVLPHGYVAEFPGYDDFILSFEQLREIIQHPTANREWHRMLTAVAGIYLITDGTTGRQYVGSAYGAEGVLGRWAAYVASGHGGNVLLKKLLGASADHARHFSFTLLRTLPRTLTREEVFAYESLYKSKLGSRAHGLNAN
jgi:hypothetical protein